MTKALDVSERRKLAVYWWIASELVRRHPELELFETHPLDGFYDCLTLVSTGSRETVHIELNRAGSIHVHPEHISFLKVEVVAAHDDPHWAVKEIERVTGLVPVAKAPPSQPRTLTLRVLAAFANAVTNDRHHWDIREVQLGDPDPSVVEVGPQKSVPESSLLKVFPIGIDIPASLIEPLSGLLTSRGAAWAVIRDKSVVAILDAEGGARTAKSRTALPELYTSVNRSITRTMVAALGDLLP